MDFDSVFVNYGDNLRHTTLNQVIKWCEQGAKLWNLAQW
jgi:hypothetical protein